MEKGNRKLLIGGEGEEKENLRRLIDRLDLRGRVILTGGVSHIKLPDLYGGAKIVIFTSENEPFGMVPVEALACGTPVIASNSGGVRETVRHGYNGILLDPMTPETLRNALNGLLEDPDLYARLQGNARPSVEGFSWDHHVARFTGILERIVKDVMKTRR